MCRFNLNNIFLYQIRNLNNIYLPAAKIIHSGECKQCITTSNTSTSVQDTTITNYNDYSLADSHPFGYWNDNGVALSTKMDTTSTATTTVHDDSIFHSVETSTFNDIFTDDATLKWMATTTTTEEELELDTSTTISDDVSSAQYVHVDDLDDDVLGDFLWDALVCNE